MIAYALSALLGVFLMLGLPVLLLLLFTVARDFHRAGLERLEAGRSRQVRR